MTYFLHTVVIGKFNRAEIILQKNFYSHNMSNTTVIKLLDLENQFDPYKFKQWMELNSFRLTVVMISIYLVGIFSLKKYSTFKLSFKRSIKQNWTSINDVSFNRSFQNMELDMLIGLESMFEIFQGYGGPGRPPFLIRGTMLPQKWGNLLFFILSDNSHRKPARLVNLIRNWNLSLRLLLFIDLIWATKQQKKWQSIC